MGGYALRVMRYRHAPTEVSARCG